MEENNKPNDQVIVSKPKLNTVLLIIIIILLVIGLVYIFISGANQKGGNNNPDIISGVPQSEIPETNTLATKKISRSAYSFEAPSSWIDTGQRNFQGCMWDGISHPANDGMRIAGEIGIYPKSCFDLSKANGKKEFTEKNGYYIIAFYDKQSGTSAAEEAETKLAYQKVVETFSLNNQTSTNTINKSEWGISFTKPTGWKLATNTTNNITLQEPVSDGDRIKIDYTTGDRITDNDAKFGPITYYFDTTSQSWMVIKPDEQNGGTFPPTVATPEMYTNSGLPVFRGTGRWATYIIPLSHSTFLKLNIGGSGNSKPLKALAETIKKN